jgi:DNA-binding XRE family transcriptional regulator
MYRDILEDSWVYQETLQKGVEKERQEELQRQRKALLTIVQGCFPEMLELTRKQIESVEDPNVLPDLTVKISLAQNVQEAVQALLALGKDDKKN